MIYSHGFEKDSTHGETDSSVLSNQLKPDCIHYFSIDFEPNKISFGTKLMEKLVYTILF